MSQLASKFRTAHVVRANQPLTDHELQVAVPSIFADAAHESRSDRYLYIPTIEVLNALRKQGFQPFMACQARVRDDSREGFAKHMLRLRHASQVDAGGSVNEIILLNSHDGSSSYQMLAGCFRFVCQNGMVCGDTFQDVRVEHRGNVVDNVIEGAYEVLKNFERVSDSREEMAAIELMPEEQVAFAKAALPLRFQEGADKPEPDQVLKRRRHADFDDDLWTTFNVLQENLVRGGVPVRKTNPKGRRKVVNTRRINGIDGNVQLNKALWTLAEEMKAIKTNQAAA